MKVGRWCFSSKRRSQTSVEGRFFLHNTSFHRWHNLEHKPGAETTSNQGTSNEWPNQGTGRAWGINFSKVRLGLNMSGAGVRRGPGLSPRTNVLSESERWQDWLADWTASSTALWVSTGLPNPNVAIEDWTTGRMCLATSEVFPGEVSHSTSMTPCSAFIMTGEATRSTETLLAKCPAHRLWAKQGHIQDCKPKSIWKHIHWWKSLCTTLFSTHHLVAAAKYAALWQHQTLPKRLLNPRSLRTVISTEHLNLSNNLVHGVCFHRPPWSFDVPQGLCWPENLFPSIMSHSWGKSNIKQQSQNFNLKTGIHTILVYSQSFLMLRVARPM